MNPEAAESQRIRTVLLVEDDESTRSFIQRFLERDGYEVVAVDAAEEGIVEAGELMPDVLISDIHLPGLSGIELASFLLAQDPALPVILITGDPDEELARRAIACGPVQYLLKPFEWFEMEAAVGFAINQRDMSGEFLPGTAPVAVSDETRNRVNPQGGSGSWSVPAADVAAWPDPEPIPDAEIGTTADQIVWGDPELIPDVEAETAADAIEWGGPEPLHDGPAETTATEITWADLESFPEAEAEPIVAETDWVELEPILSGDAATEADVAMEWVDLEPIPEAAPVGDWLDQVDRASWAGPGHGDRVSGLALALFAALDEPGSLDSQDLALAARVHEVGRLHIPDGDPVGLAVRGAEVLAEAGFLAAVAETVRHMHERWDGTSGPGRLSGSQIPMGAQLLAVADALDHYGSAWIRSGLESGESADRAMNLVTVQQNRAFSPIVVGAMLQAAGAIREICMKPRPPDALQPSFIPALAAAESVPFALFASE